MLLDGPFAAAAQMLRDLVPEPELEPKPALDPPDEPEPEPDPEAAPEPELELDVEPAKGKSKGQPKGATGKGPHILREKKSASVVIAIGKHQFGQHNMNLPKWLKELGALCEVAAERG
jgi:hypothetical protein